MNRQFQTRITEANCARNARLMFDNKELTRKSLDYIEHISRYAFASQFVKNKITLDIACGTGYGSCYLTRYRPKTVLGVDVSREAVKKGKELCDDKLLELLIGDATNTGFKGNIFDVIVSFETLEHLDNYERFLGEVKRVLKNDGMFIISTPNKEAFSGYNKFYFNKFHVKEFTIPEFHSLLQRYFEKVDLYGEIRIGILYKTLRDIRRMLLEGFRVDLVRLYRIAGWFLSRFVESGSIYPLRTVEKAMPKFLIAVCHNMRL